MTDELKRIAEQGRLIPLRPRSKAPRDRGYFKNEYGLEDLENVNVGLLIDETMIDLDFDWPESQSFATQLVDQCGMTFGWGRKGRLTHLVYRAEIDKPINFELPHEPGAPAMPGPHGRMILQVRTSKGGEPYHVMIPPSTHPDGDDLEWFYEGEHGEGDPFVRIMETDAESLIAYCGTIAGFSALARFYPAQGSRDEAVLSLVGCMARAGWDEERINEFVATLCAVTGDPDVAERQNKAKRSIERLEKGRSVRGIPAAAKHLGIPVSWMREIAIWFGWANRNPEGGGACVFLSPVVRDVSRQAWAALQDYDVDGSPGVYRYGDALARVDDGRFQVLNSASFRHELNRSAVWLKPSDKKPVAVSCPKDVVEDMMSARAAEIAVPELKSVAIVPCFTRDGRLLKEPGFDEASGIFLGLQVDVDVPDDPTPQDVRRALRMLWRPLADFPFEDRSDKAHAIAMVLEPYMRDMFDRCPMYFVSKPEAGTGASLMIETALYPTLGEWPEAQTPKRQEEMGKVITATLLDGSRVFYLDNCNYLNSPELASLITAATYKARILGKSEMARVPVRLQIVGSGNNTDITRELNRRTCEIRLNAQVASPDERDVSLFRIPDLRSYVQENRSELVSAALTIIYYWVRCGMPQGKKHKASFERYAALMSGLFDCINVRGLFETPEDRKMPDPMEEAALGVLIAMHDAKNNRLDLLKGVDVERPKASDVVRIVEACTRVDVDLESFGRGRDAARGVGTLLRRYTGRPFEVETQKGATVRLTVSHRDIHGTTRWVLESERIGGGDASAEEPMGFERVDPLEDVPF